MGVTIKDIARMSGVSYSTVSKALNDSPLVKPETKEKILKASKELGYTPNFVARNLVSKKSKTIGLVWPTIERVALSSLVTQVNKAVENNGYSMILSVNKVDAAIEMFKRFQVDGIIVFEEDWDSSIDPNNVSHMPILSYGVPDHHAYPAISANPQKAIFAAVDYLYQLGHTEITYIGHLSTSDRRQIEKSKGFETAIQAFGLNSEKPFSIDTKGLDWDHGYRAVKKRFAYEDKPTAIISGSYEISVGILHGIKELDQRVPQDISIIGYDNIPHMGMLETPLSSVGVPIDQLSKQMVDMLLGLIENPSTTPFTQALEPQINDRGSCSAP